MFLVLFEGCLSIALTLFFGYWHGDSSWYDTGIFMYLGIALLEYLTVYYAILCIIPLWCELLDSFAFAYAYA